MEYEYKGYKVKIEQDPDSENPREWDGPTSTMVCFHKRDSYGDKHKFKDPADLARYLKSNAARLVVLPVYMMDHSGVTLSTTPFNCPWDSGQLGYIYMTYPHIRENWGIKKVTNQYVEKARQLLIDEVATYSQWLQGDVYGYSIESLDDSCWGFYGMDACKETAERVVDSHITSGEYICHAAVKSVDGQIIKGKSHADCFHYGANNNIDMARKADDQGFVTNTGRFVNRKEGGIIAFNAKQIDKITPILFSEDFWSAMYNGKYDYDSVDGYIIKETLGVMDGYA